MKMKKKLFIRTKEYGKMTVLNLQSAQEVGKVERIGKKDEYVCIGCDVINDILYYIPLEELKMASCWGTSNRVEINKAT